MSIYHIMLKYMTHFKYNLFVVIYSFKVHIINEHIKNAGSKTIHSPITHCEVVQILSQKLLSKYIMKATLASDRIIAFH